MAVSDHKPQKPHHGWLRWFRLEVGLGLLLLLTLLALVFERQILEVDRVLDPGAGELRVYSDRVDGGDSDAEIIDSRELQWRCHLVEQETYSQCGFEFILTGDRQQGIDLRRYDQLYLDMDYEGPTDSIRLYLRNFDPRYSRPTLNSTTKFNQLEFDAERAREKEAQMFSLDDFFVANWWVRQFRIPPSQSHPQFDNIVVFEVQTGSAPQPGEHRFDLGEIRLVGQAIPSEQWYQLIVAVWVLAAIAFLLVRLWQAKRELTYRSLRERELMGLYSLLDERGRELEDRVRTDPLTGAFNRQGVEEAIKLGLAEYKRERKPLSLIMLDVDHFKPVNDNYGHAVGDRILAGLSRAVQSQIRGTDQFARWGGEEFVVVCRNTRLDEAQRLAEKLRTSLEGETFGEEVGITISLGVASLRPDDSIEAMFKRTDEALYRAKAEGRNRVVISP